MSYTAPPAIGDVALRRPSSMVETPDPIGADVELAGGGLRRFDLGVRFGVAMTWDRIPEADKDVIVGAVTRGPLAYTHLDGRAFTVYADAPPTVTALPMTDPVLFAVSVALRSREPTR